MHTHKEMLGMLFLLNQTVREAAYYHDRIARITAKEAEIDRRCAASEKVAGCGPDATDRTVAEFELKIAETEARHRREMLREEIEAERYFIEDYERQAREIRKKLPSPALQLFDRLTGLTPGDVMSYEKDRACAKCAGRLDDAIMRRLEVIMEITQCPHCDRILEV
ncbi:MAG: hypothetical protein K8I27_01965 [Planctomycetes bacterium]|nr:hypothetical protein [Planctomycetota bacterium]